MVYQRLDNMLSICYRQSNDYKIRFTEKEDGSGGTLLGLDIFAAYVAFACISTLYAYWWDIKMDWGFLDHTSTGHKNKYLRDELLYAGGKKVCFTNTKKNRLIHSCVTAVLKKVRNIPSVTQRVLDLYCVSRKSAVENKPALSVRILHHHGA